MTQKIFYLTKHKLKELKQEYKDLLNFEHLKTKGDTPKIFQSEDMNPEYLAFQEDLSFLRSRIVELDNILQDHELIKSPPKNKQNFVGLGARVGVAVEQEKDEFTIVGTLEANPSLGKISNESPVGKALIGHAIGEEVIVSSPIKVIYKIVKISYPSV